MYTKQEKKGNQLLKSIREPTALAIVQENMWNYNQKKTCLPTERVNSILVAEEKRKKN